MNDFYSQRAFTASFRAVGQDGEGSGHIIEGLAAVCEQETKIESAFGDFIEVIRKGAFNNTDFTDVKLLVNHNFDGVALARSRRNNKSDKPDTMQLFADDAGIHIRADLDTVRNSQALALYSAVERGDMDGMSYCFFVSKDNQKVTKRDGIVYREILAVDKVIEVSVVNFPAYAGTNINSRSLDSDKRMLDSIKMLLDNSDEKRAIEILKLRTEIFTK